MKSIKRKCLLNPKLNLKQNFYSQRQANQTFQKKFTFKPLQNVSYYLNGPLLAAILDSQKTTKISPPTRKKVFTLKIDSSILTK